MPETSLEAKIEAKSEIAAYQIVYGPSNWKTILQVEHEQRTSGGSTVGISPDDCFHGYGGNAVKIYIHTLLRPNTIWQPRDCWGDNSVWGYSLIGYYINGWAVKKLDSEILEKLLNSSLPDAVKKVLKRKGRDNEGNN